VKLDEWSSEQYADLKEKYHFLSDEELALVLIEQTLADSGSLAAAFAPFDDLVQDEDVAPRKGKAKADKCSGKCQGSKKEEKVVDGACPSPCDPDIIKDLTKRAKKAARKAAIDICLDKDADCICADGTYKVSSKCQTQTVGDAKFCYYKVKAKYLGGKCKSVP